MSGKKPEASGTKLIQGDLTEARRNSPYPVVAFEFVRDGLTYTSERVQTESPEADENHVSGQQLCFGLRDLALERWGALAPLVLNSWSVFRTDDFGKMVFALVKAGALRTSKGDSPEDFRAVYDFSEVFDASHLRDRLRRHRTLEPQSKQ